MNQRSNTILVVGATGRFAGLVVPELARRGARVRALIRNEARGTLAKSLGAAEIAIGDLRERGSLDQALQGTAGVFHIGPAFAPDEAAMGVSMVDFRNRHRIERFFELYRDGYRLNITQAAFEAGFGSYAQFHRVFRKTLGYGPAELRRRRSQEPPEGPGPAPVVSLKDATASVSR